MKILHVTDAMNAGVSEGIFTICKVTSKHDHYLLWSSHNDSPTVSESSLHTIFQDFWKWEGNIFQKLNFLAKLNKELKPDIIHLHSSIAGVYGRLLKLNSIIIYSPHCYAFQRKDISIFSKLFFYLCEFILIFRTSATGVCWPIEEKYVRTYLKSSKILQFPLINFQHILSAELNKNYSNNIFYSLGRIRPQKDPKFLLKVISKLRPYENFSFFWIGEGDLKLAKALVSNNVKIIPWQNKEDIWKNSQNMNCTLISSKWESGPLTFYESLSNGIPVIVRDIPAFDFMEFPKATTPNEFSLLIKKISNDEKFRKSLFDHQIKAVINSFKPWFDQYSTSDPYTKLRYEK